MDFSIVTIIAFAIILVLMLIGMPLAFAFATGAIILILYSGIDSSFAIQGVFYRLDSFVLMAIPLFILSGNLMSVCGISKKLVDFAQSFVSNIRGGLGIATVIATMLFGAICGASSATVAAIGSIVLPQMTKLGYPRAYTTALIACSGVLGQLIPPSLPMIVFGLLTGTSVAACFLAGVVPGFLLVVLYSFINWILCKRIPSIPEPTKTSLLMTAKDIGKNFKSAFFGLVAPVIILGGIYGGIFTPTEAGCIAVIYSIPVGFFIYKKLTIASLIESTYETINVVGVLFAIFIFIIIVSKILTFYRVPDILAHKLISISDNKIFILLFINIFMLFVGMLMDDFSAQILAVPLLWPVFMGIGIHPVQMAAIIAVNQGTGQITPPVATNLFIASRISGVPVPDILKHVWPFFIFGNIPILILTTYVPSISLWLPKLVMGNI